MANGKTRVEWTSPPPMGVDLNSLLFSAAEVVSHVEAGGAAQDCEYWDYLKKGLTEWDQHLQLTVNTFSNVPR